MNYPTIPKRALAITAAASATIALAASSPSSTASLLDDVATNNDRTPSAVPDKLARAAPWLADSPQNVLFDQPGDDAIWACTPSYKARFDQTGVLYVPFLGASAPRNYPITLRLDKVLVGGEPVSFADDAKPSLNDSTVRFDRGTVRERYELELSAMEQIFELDALPDRGDLALRLAVDSELLASETLEQIEFTNARGGVSYTKAVVYDATGSTLEASTVLTNDAIEIRVPDAALAEAVFPITIDPVIMTWAIEDYQEYSRSPSVAFVDSENRYTVVWERNYSNSDGDVYSELYDANGTPLGGSRVAIDVTTHNWRAPRVAGNNREHQFFVVATDGSSGSRVISGRMRAAFSNAVGPQFQVSPDFLANDLLNPDVGGDPNMLGPTSYCVVYEHAYSGTDHDIFAQLVDPYETVGSLIYLETSLENERRPSISKCNGAPPKASQEWNVVWQTTYEAGDEDIYGAQIHWDGSITTEPFTVDYSSTNDEYPSVSSVMDGGTGPRPFMVAYQRGGSGSDRHIVGTVFVGDGFITTADLTALEGAPLDRNHIQPAVDSCGTSFTVAYSEEYSGLDYDVYAATFCLHGSVLVLGEGHQNLAYTVDTELQPDIVAAHSGGAASDRFMAAWSKTIDATVFGDIYGGLYDVEYTCPLNDDCDQAIDVVSGEAVYGDLSNASDDGASPCAGNFNPDVWYRFTAPSEGVLRASTCGTHDATGVDQGMDTVLSVHSGCPGDAMNTVACDDDAGPPNCGGLDEGVQRDSVIVMCMEPGEEALIRVTHYGDAIDNGAFQLNVQFTCPGDTDFDADVDVDDLVRVIVNWGCSSSPGECPGDVNCDGVVNVDDLINGVILNWGFCQ